MWVTSSVHIDFFVAYVVVVRPTRIHRLTPRASGAAWNQVMSAGSVLLDVVLKTVVLREPRTGAAP